MKKIILEKFKLINGILLALLIMLLIYMNINYETWFKDVDTYYFYNYYYAIYAPVFAGGKILAIILGGLLFLPSRFFMKWLFFVLPIPLLVTYWAVQDISVYSGGVLYISRAQMATNGMMLLAVVTVVFVAGHLLYDWNIRRKVK